MARHAIVVASREWCEAAASGMIKIYDFRSRRHRIHVLAPGSVCIVLAKKEPGRPQAFCGEFRVKEVREVDSQEYNRLASQGLIYNPQTLDPDEKRWIILFEEFRKYRREVPKSELTDVRTRTSEKPVAEWAILGLSYIDETVVREIRRRAGEFSLGKKLGVIEEKMTSISQILEVSEDQLPITHSCAEYMLLSIGRDLGFKVYTADPSRECGSRRLASLANMSREDLGRFVGPSILESLSRVDVVWYSDREHEFYAFEVIIDGSMRDALRRLSAISGLQVKSFIVSREGKWREYKQIIRLPAFTSIRHKCSFISLRELAEMYILTSLWKQSVEILRLPYTSYTR